MRTNETRFQFKNKDLPIEFNELSIFNHEISNYETRNVKKQSFFIPNVNTDNFGLKSLRFSAPFLWNKHLKIDNTINSFTKITSFKKNCFFVIIIIIYYYFPCYFLSLNNIKLNKLIKDEITDARLLNRRRHPCMSLPPFCGDSIQHVYIYFC